MQHICTHKQNQCWISEDIKGLENVILQIPFDPLPGSVLIRFKPIWLPDSLPLSCPVGRTSHHNMISPAVLHVSLCAVRVNTLNVSHHAAEQPDSILICPLNKFQVPRVDHWLRMLNSLCVSVCLKFKLSVWLRRESEATQQCGHQMAACEQSHPGSMKPYLWQTWLTACEFRGFTLDRRSGPV